MLEERLWLMRIEKYGTAGEKLSHAQMQLFELEPIVSEMIEQAESEHAPVHRSTKDSGKHPGRQGLPPNLPRVERVLPCTPDQRVCKRCRKETSAEVKTQRPAGSFSRWSLVTATVAGRRCYSFSTSLKSQNGEKL